MNNNQREIMNRSMAYSNDSHLERFLFVDEAQQDASLLGVQIYNAKDLGYGGARGNFNRDDQLQVLGKLKEDKLAEIAQKKAEYLQQQDRDVESGRIPASCLRCRGSFSKRGGLRLCKGGFCVIIESVGSKRFGEGALSGARKGASDAAGRSEEEEWIRRRDRLHFGGGRKRRRAGKSLEFSV